MSLGSKAWRLRWSKLVMGVSVMRSGIALNRYIGLGMLLIFAQRSASKDGKRESAIAMVKGVCLVSLISSQAIACASSTLPSICGCL
jgi:class 3 adenylate cyclase